MTTAPMRGVRRHGVEQRDDKLIPDHRSPRRGVDAYPLGGHQPELILSALNGGKRGHRHRNSRATTAPQTHPYDRGWRS